MKFSLISLLVVSGAAFSAAPNNDMSSSAIVEQLNQLKRLMQARGAAQINLQQQVVELQDELSELKGESETQAHKLDQIVDRQRELYIEIERRLTNIQAPQQAATTTTPTSTAESAYNMSLSESDAYDQAVNLILKERRYDEAIPEFKSFIKNYPKSVYIANAHYWLGQLLFNKSLFSDAKTHFDQVIKYFPDSTKRSDSMLKQATVMQKLGDKAAAKALFEQVISEYPDTTSATLAKSRLSAL